MFEYGLERRRLAVGEKNYCRGECDGLARRRKPAMVWNEDCGNQKAVSNCPWSTCAGQQMVSLSAGASASGSAKGEPRIGCSSRGRRGPFADIASPLQPLLILLLHRENERQRRGAFFVSRNGIRVGP